MAAVAETRELWKNKAVVLADKQTKNGPGHIPAGGRKPEAGDEQKDLLLMLPWRWQWAC